MNSKRILLVEDNPSDVKLTKRALEQNQITNELIVAEDGREALDYLFATGKYAGREIGVPCRGAPGPETAQIEGTGGLTAVGAR